MNAFQNHFLFEFRTGIRDKSLLLMNYLFPLGLYIMLGLLLTKLNPFFTDTIIPAMIVIGIMSGTILSMPNPLVTARETGIFRSFKINGVPAISILVIPALTTILHMVIVAIIITITAPLLFGAPAPVKWWGFILFFLLVSIAHACLGMLIGVISSSTRNVVLWSQLIFLPSMLIGGLMIPFSMLPGVLARIALLLPATHAMNIFQGLSQNQTTAFNILWSIIVLIAGVILSCGLAVYLFSWDNRNATRRGHPAIALFTLLPYVLAALLISPQTIN